jgi:DNA-binding transcriptional MerR regulator
MREISKKDLLRETGISYGQLYRWKRDGLIPEEWFIKRSAHTGQETYFPRAQALARIQAILEMKDSRSLEEIRDTLGSSNDLRFTGETLVLMTRMATETFDGLSGAKDTSLTIEGWALVAGVYEAGVEAGLAYDELVALTDGVLACVRTTDATLRAKQTSRVADVVSGVHPPPFQVSVASINGAYHFITSTTAAELRGDAKLTVRATRPLQVYRDRAQAALLSGAWPPTGRDRPPTDHHEQADKPLTDHHGQAGRKVES